MASINSSNQQAFKCSQCTSSFGSKYGVVQHIVANHVASIHEVFKRPQKLEEISQLNWHLFSEFQLTWETLKPLKLHRIITRKTWKTDFIIVCQNLIGLYS